MWIKLDFTPLYLGGLLLGLLLIGIGLAVRWNVPKAAPLGVFIAIVGAIPALLGGFLLLADSYGKLRDKQRNRTWTEQLPEDREIQGVRLPRGTKVEWMGRPAVLNAATLAQPLEILGVPFEGEVKFVNTYGANDIHLATDLEKGTLAVEHVIDSVACQPHKEVEFFRGGPYTEATRKAQIGKLRRCTLASELEFKGNRYQSGSEITFNGFDGVDLGILAVDQDVDGHWCKAGTEVERPDYRAIRFTLARDETIGRVACKAGTEVVLERTNGLVTSAVLSKDQLLDAIPCRGGEAVGFEHGDGSYPLDSCIVAREVTILGVPWPAGSSLEALSRDFLLATSSNLTIGEVKIVGRSKIQMKKTPPSLDHVTPDENGYAEFRGARFADLNFYEGTSYGHLREPATVDGVAYEAGALVRFKIAPGR